MSSVCGFEAFINGKHVIGVVKEKEKARAEYTKAISEGHGAYLMEEEKPDIFSISVGNLPAFAEVLIKIIYVTELGVDGPNIVFVLPSSVSPPHKNKLLDEKIQGTVKTVKVREMGSLDFTVSLDMRYNIKRVGSPSHPKALRIKQTDTKATLQLIENTDLEGRPLEISIGLEKPYEPRMWVEMDNKGGQEYAAMLVFYPQFSFIPDDQRNEFIFVVDRSSSMKGDPLDDMKRALAAAIDQISHIDCTFNIIGFGSNYESLFVESKSTKNGNAIGQARDYIAKLKADFGGTDLWPVLRSIFLLSDHFTNRNIFIFTDGMPSNSEQISDLVKQNSSHTRVFGFGFGSACSRHVVRTLARVGGGRSEFLEPKKLPNKKKIERQLKRALQPALSEISVSWKTGRQVRQSPNQINSLFSGERQIVYGLVDYCTQATLNAQYQNQEISTMVSTQELSFTKGNLIHSLAARGMIRDWNDGNYDENRVQHDIIKRKRKDEVIALSIKYSIVSQFTSFVAIEDRDNDSPTNAPPISQLVHQEEVDELSYMGWKELCDLDIGKSREELQAIAKCANNPQEVFDAVKAIAYTDVEFNEDERHLFNKAISDLLLPHIAPWKQNLYKEEEQKQAGKWVSVCKLREERKPLEEKIVKIINDGLKLLDEQLIVNSASPENRCCFIAKKAGLLSYLAQIKGIARGGKSISEKAALLFDEANRIAVKELSADSNARLQFVKEFSEYNYSMEHNTEEAILQLQQAIETAEGKSEKDENCKQTIESLVDVLKSWSVDTGNVILEDAKKDGERKGKERKEEIQKEKRKSESKKEPEIPKKLPKLVLEGHGMIEVTEEEQYIPTRKEAKEDKAKVPIRGMKDKKKSRRRKKRRDYEPFEDFLRLSEQNEKEAEPTAAEPIQQPSELKTEELPSVPTDLHTDPSDSVSAIPKVSNFFERRVDSYQKQKTQRTFVLNEMFENKEEQTIDRPTPPELPKLRKLSNKIAVPKKPAQKMESVRSPISTGESEEPTPTIPPEGVSRTGAISPISSVTGPRTGKRVAPKASFNNKSQRRKSSKSVIQPLGGEFVEDGLCLNGRFAQQPEQSKSEIAWDGDFGGDWDAPFDEKSLQDGEIDIESYDDDYRGYSSEEDYSDDDEDASFALFSAAKPQISTRGPRNQNVSNIPTSSPYTEEPTRQISTAPTSALNPQSLRHLGGRASASDRITRVQAQVDELKDIMANNIEQVLERGDTLDSLIERSEELSFASGSFLRAPKKSNYLMGGLSSIASNLKQLAPGKDMIRLGSGKRRHVKKLDVAEPPEQQQRWRGLRGRFEAKKATRECDTIPTIGYNVNPVAYRKKSSSGACVILFGFFIMTVVVCIILAILYFSLSYFFG